MIVKLLLLAFVGCTYAAPQSRIVNGEAALQGAHPHQATLQMRSGGYWYHICGGSLISHNKVLTAAHCLDGISVSSLRIGLGWHQLTTASGWEQTFGVSQITVHKNYNANAPGYPNDIAVLTLSASAELNSYVKAVQIAPKGSSFAQETCIISGWGKLSGSGSSAITLKQAHITKITNNICSNMWSVVNGAAIYGLSHLCLRATKIFMQR